MEDTCNATCWSRFRITPVINGFNCYRSDLIDNQIIMYIVTEHATMRGIEDIHPLSIWKMLNWWLRCKTWKAKPDLLWKTSFIHAFSVLLFWPVKRDWRSMKESTKTILKYLVQSAEYGLVDLAWRNTCSNIWIRKDQLWNAQNVLKNYLKVLWKNT